MKLYRNAIILIIILALLFGVYLFVTKTKSKDSSQDRRNFEKIIDLDTMEMEEITIENEDEKLIFVKKDKEWELKHPRRHKV